MVIEVELTMIINSSFQTCQLLQLRKTPVQDLRGPINLSLLADYVLSVRWASFSIFIVYCWICLMTCFWNG